MIWRLHGDRQLDFGSRVQIMGVLNVTPDSFYDGGRHVDPQRAADHAMRLAAEGAAIIDIGGESTRPGAERLWEGDEIERVVPAIRACAAMGAGILADKEVCISSTNRNFKGRMGANSARIYLASPYTVAATAVAGHITDPREMLA